MNKILFVFLILLILPVSDVYAIVVEEPISKTTLGGERDGEEKTCGVSYTR